MTIRTQDDNSPPTLSVQIPSSSPMTEVCDSEDCKISLRSHKRPRIARLVSQDEFALSGGGAYVDKESSNSLKPAPSPRCVSERYNVKNSAASSTIQSPALPNPLCNNNVLKAHVSALRLEADLHPMRLILARLMSHPTYNRKGLFNRPVDPVALGLPDYYLVVKQPMDLGSIKARVHAVAYESREQAANDIRLVFDNAMRYNPPHNEVHRCARELLKSFEQGYNALSPVVSSSEACEGAAPCSSSKSLNVSAPLVPKAPDVPSDASSVVNTQTTRAQAPAPVPLELPKRRSSLPPFLPHSCHSCKGRTCTICKQGCLSLEPTLLVCQGYNCAGAKIRKGAPYFISCDGNRQFCQKCYASLPPTLPQHADQDPPFYKQDLLKRMNNEEIAEEWLTCGTCSQGVHHVCAMHNDYVHSKDAYTCPTCQTRDTDSLQSGTPEFGPVKSYTFVSGSDVPVPISSVVPGVADSLDAGSLKECAISSFIQAKVRDCMNDIPNADKTVVVRVISDCNRQFVVPDVVRNHFRMASESDDVIKPPSQVHYQQKAIALFQKIDGLDVCIFCMYVQEYDSSGEFDQEDTPIDANATPSKRVYIAYLDSVEHFRPRTCRSQVFQEMLVSYLATARERGYATAHIWACPPSRGNSFVFWNHPASQRTPTKDRLVSWYHVALSRAVQCGVVTDVKSLFESDFEPKLNELDKEVKPVSQVNPLAGRMVCPPLLEGDFWIEEAVRIHGTSMARHLKTRSPSDICVWNVSSMSSQNLDPCPAMQVATLLHDRILTHPSSVPFHRPVNAAALKLKDYHKIVTQPMDLGTVYSRCVLGEYRSFHEVVSDIELMVSNAKRFNPAGHHVHIKAGEILTLFFEEVKILTNVWNPDGCDSTKPWESCADISMSLDMVVEVEGRSAPAKEVASVVIEDDRSSDGSKSLSSSSSIASSPFSGRSSVKDDDSMPAAPDLSSAAGDTSFAPRRRVSVCSSRKKSKKRPPMQIEKLELLTGGPEAVFHSMVGNDTWLMDKKNAAPPKGQGPAKKTGAKRRRNSLGSACDEPAKRRRQSWLGEEVGDSVRKMRTSFFSCSLKPKLNMSVEEQSKLGTYQSYTDVFKDAPDAEFSASSHVADARHALLEFSQFRHFEFDTLRRAKYSTTMLLYHLHHKEAPGIIPTCTACRKDIKEVRWHKVKKACERKRCPKNTPASKVFKPTEPEWEAEELCTSCHTGHANGEDFIPIPVSAKSIEKN